MINKKLLLLCIGLIMTTQMIFSQVPSYVPSNGLVGYWPFNGNANDDSLNGNNGTVNGATLTTDRFGNANSAYNFDGVDDYINVMYSNALHSTNGTINVWIKTSGQFTSQKVIFAQSSGRPQLIAASQGINGNQISNAAGIHWKATNGQFPNAQSVTAIDNAQWVMITGIYSLDTFKVYINGTLEKTNSTALVQDNCSQSDFQIGGFNTTAGCGNDVGFSQMYSGIIDDIGMWNRALTQQEITNMYNGVNYSDTCNAVSGSLVNGLVAYYPFCGNANDQSGNGLNGVVNGAALTTDRFGNTNSAYNFDGVNDYIEVQNSQNLNSPTWTISTWINVNGYYFGNVNGNISDGNIIVGKGTDFNSGFYGLGYRSQSLKAVSSFGIGSQANAAVSTTNITLNNWINVVGSWDGVKMKIYVNGQLENINSSISNNSGVNNENLFFGTMAQNNLYPYWLNGKIDDVGIWNRALSQQEITQLFNQNQCITNITVTDTLIINVGQLSYINPVTYANNITIYPNPANTQVNISFNNITELTGGNINIVNSLGQQVASTPITLSGTSTTMPLNSWGGTGLYFVQIVNAQGIVVDVKKIILQ